MLLLFVCICGKLWHLNHGYTAERWHLQGIAGHSRYWLFFRTTFSGWPLATGKLSSIKHHVTPLLVICLHLTLHLLNTGISILRHDGSTIHSVQLLRFKFTITIISFSILLVTNSNCQSPFKFCGFYVLEDAFKSRDFNERN